MGLMQPKVKRELAEDVLPWLIEKTQGFLDEDTGASHMTEKVMTHGILEQRMMHAKTLREKDEWRQR